MPALDFVLPGDPATLTGGYLYDRRIVEALGASGWTTRVLRLADDFPGASVKSLLAADELLAAIPGGRTVVIDGLALADLAAAVERHAARLRIVALVHHPLGDERGLDDETAARLHRDERRAWRAARGVIVTSRWTSRRIAADGIPVSRIRVVEPGTDRPEPGGAAAAEAADAPRFLCVATLTERKGHAVLLDALADVADRAWRLDCVGSTVRDPSTAAEVRARIERLGLADRVILHGEVPHATLAALYRRADAFVLPSYLEGYGMALAEALAHGVPVVAANAGAVPDTVGGAGLLVPPGDTAALAAALQQLLDDGALRSSLAARARQRARALPTWPIAGARFAAALAAFALQPAVSTG